MPPVMNMPSPIPPPLCLLAISFLPSQLLVAPAINDKGRTVYEGLSLCDRRETGKVQLEWA